MRIPNCSSCDVQMQHGFMLDRTGNHDSSEAYWVSGDYWSFMLGRERTLPVVTYRCPNCGLLQSYAVCSDERTRHEAPDQQFVDDDREESVEDHKKELVA